MCSPSDALEPVLLTLRFDAAPGLMAPAVGGLLDDLDALYRVAAGTYGTPLPRRKAHVWPPARAHLVSVGYGSPVEVGLLTDAQTLWYGLGVGTGVIGLSALVKWAYGIDLDYRLRRATGHADLAEAEARQARAQAEIAGAEADVTEARLRDAEAQAQLARFSRPDPATADLVPAMAAAPTLPSSQDQADLVEAAMRDARPRRARALVKQLQIARPRLVRVAARARRFPRATGDVRDLSEQQRALLDLPADGSAPLLPTPHDDAEDHNRQRHRH